MLRNNSLEINKDPLELFTFHPPPPERLQTPPVSPPLVPNVTLIITLNFQMENTSQGKFQPSHFKYLNTSSLDDLQKKATTIATQ